MSNFDFSHMMAGAEVQADQSRPYEFLDLKGSPILHCLPATDENKGYRDDRLGRINRRRKDLKRGIQITPALMAKARNEDRELFSRHCVKGWDRIATKDGKSVPFSPEAVKAFLDAVPDYLFDEFRQWLAEPTNFIDPSDADDDDEDGESLGKSSATT